MECLQIDRITGYELLALNIDGLKMMGIDRAGTVCLLLKEIALLEKASRGCCYVGRTQSLLLW